MVMIFCLAFAVGGVAAAQSPPAPEKILAGLSERYRQLASLKTAYNRVARTPSTDPLFKGGSAQNATGALYWARPDRLLLDQKAPQPEAMVTDGKTIWWHIPAEKIVYRYQDVDVAGQLRPLLSFLSGINSLTADFDVSPAPADDTRPGQYGLALLPKVSEGGEDKLTVWCGPDFALTGFKLESVTGETTDFYFFEFVDNPTLDEALFNFKVPSGTEVVEEE
jgi:outer membrane lipoprotein carrier protein